MVKVSKKGHQIKHGKLEIRNKKTDKHSKINSRKLHKNPTKILTNARLTVPHLQSGIFMKGKSSQTYHRKEDGKLNLLNKARMNEKLSEILNLAKNSDKSNEEMTFNDADTCTEQTNLPSTSFHLKNEDFSRSSYPLTINEQQEGIEFHQSLKRISEDDCTTEDEIENEKYNFNGPSFTSNRIQCGENNDINYKEFKIFLTFFDNTVSLHHAFTEDFIACEKLDLKKKKRLSASNSISQSLSSSREEVRFHSQYQEGANKEMENGIINDTKDGKYNHRISKPKNNPNYNVFKNTRKMEILYKDIKKPESKTKNIFSRDLLPKNSNKRSMFYDNKNILSNNVNVLKEHNECEEKSIFLNPMSFLTNSLPEINDNSHSSESTKSSLNGFEFLEHTLHSSSFSAPPGLKIPSDLKEETSSFKILSQPCISHKENERCLKYKNNDIPEQFEQSSSRLNSMANHLMHSSQLRVEKKKGFNLIFQDEKELPCHLGKHEETEEFFHDDNTLTGKSDTEDHLKYRSHYSQPNDLFPYLDRTITNKNRIKFVYSPNVTKAPPLASPIRQNSNKYSVLENRNNSPIHSTQTPFHRTKTDFSAILNTQEVDVRQNNFWHRRKMF